MVKFADMTPEEREKAREYQRQWYRNRTPEQKAEQVTKKKRWRANNLDKMRAYWQRYRAEHREELRAYDRAYYHARYAAGLSGRAAAVEALNAALGKNTLYAAAAAAIPRTLPRHVRDDAIQSAILAVLEGEIGEAEIATHARRFIGAAWGLVDKFRMHSLDAIIPGTDSLRLGDTLSEAVTCTTGF